MIIVSQLLMGNIAPLEKQLREKISALENFQTPKTSQEFFDNIYQTFKSNFHIPTPLFRAYEYDLLFRDSEYESIDINLWPSGIHTARYHFEDGKIEEEITVRTTLAYKIPGLIKDIILGRTKPRQRVPFEAIINGKVKKFKYSER